MLINLASTQFERISRQILFRVWNINRLYWRKNSNTIKFFW